MKKFTLPKEMIVFIATMLLGIIVVQQIYLHRKINEISQPDQTQALGLEVSQLYKNNIKLQDELDQLTQEKQKTSQSLADREAATVNLQETLEKYQIIAGIKTVEGQGVKIKVSNKLETVQLVDLVNALRNIGAEAISINNHRIGPKTGLDGFQAPYEILVIGDSEVLSNSLTRPGGIIAQIGEKMEVTKMDLVLIPSLEK